MFYGVLGLGFRDRGGGLYTFVGGFRVYRLRLGVLESKTEN